MRLVVLFMNIIIKKILYAEIGQHLEDLCNLVNEYFLNDQYMTLQSHSWVTEPFKV